MNRWLGPKERKGRKKITGPPKGAPPLPVTAPSRKPQQPRSPARTTPRTRTPPEPLPEPPVAPAPTEPPQIQFASEWLQLPKDPTPRKSCGVAVLDKKHAIFVGGQDQSCKPSDKVIMVNVKTGLFSELASLNRPKRDCASIIVHRLLFVFGGIGEDGRHLREVEVLDLNESHSEQRFHLLEDSPLPVALCNATLAADDEFVYLIGGVGDGAQALDTFYRIHIQTKRLVVLPSMNKPRHGAMAVIVKHQLMVFGGYNYDDKYLSSVETFLLLDRSPTNTSWKLADESNFLPQGRAYGIVFVMGDDEIVVAGGRGSDWKWLNTFCHHADCKTIANPTTTTSFSFGFTSHPIPPFPGSSEYALMSTVVGIDRLIVVSWDCKACSLKFKPKKPVAAHVFGNKSPEAIQRLEYNDELERGRSKKRHLESLQLKLAEFQSLEQHRQDNQSSTRARLAAEVNALEETIASTTGAFHDIARVQANQEANRQLPEVKRLLSNTDDLYPTVEKLEEEINCIGATMEELTGLRLPDKVAMPVLEGLSAAYRAVQDRIAGEIQAATAGEVAAVMVGPTGATTLPGVSSSLRSPAPAKHVVPADSSPPSLSEEIQQSRQQLANVVNNRRSIGPVDLHLSYIQSCTNNFEQGRILGVGGFGAVYKGTDAALNTQFAVKQIVLPQDDPWQRQLVIRSAKKEVAALMRFRHPNIVALFGICLSDRLMSQYLVFELASNGSVARFLQDDRGRAQLSSDIRLSILYQSCRAINFLHTRGCDNIIVYHRDIKSDNICLTEDCIAKVIDCGVAKFVVDETKPAPSVAGVDGPRIHSVMTTTGRDSGAGTRGYMDSEYARGVCEYDASCDIFSMGVVIAELVTGVLQMASLGDLVTRYDVTKNTRSWHDLERDADALVEWDDGALSEVCRLAVRCMHPSRSERPTMANVVQKLCWLCHQEDLGRVHPASTMIRRPVPSCAAPRCSLCNRRNNKVVRCSELHVTCVECLEDVVRGAIHCSGATGPSRTSSTGSSATMIRCPFASCTSAPFQDHVLFGKISSDLYLNLMQERSLDLSMDNTLAVVLRKLKSMSIDVERLVARVDHGFGQMHSTMEDNIRVQEALLKKVTRGVNRTLQALAYLTAGETAKCPRLIWVVPARIGNVPLSHDPTKWARGLFTRTYRIYFICQHSMTAVVPPLEIRVTRKWLVQAAPALKASLIVLNAAAAILSGLPFPLPAVLDSAAQLQMENEFVGELLPDAARAALEKCQSSIFYGQEQDSLDVSNNREIQKLVGESFRLIAQKANKAKRSQWKQQMVPVVNSEGTTIWVKNEYQHLYDSMM